jgi:hypothetical protein
LKRIPLAPLVVFCNADTYLFFPATPWMSAAEAESIREALETRNMPASNNMTLTVGMQTCNSIDAVDNAVALASSRSTDGLTYPGAFIDKTATTGNKQLVRFGYLAKNTTASDTTVRWCWASAAVETQKK